MVSYLATVLFYIKQLREAIARNQKLLTLSVMQATNHIMVDAQRFTEIAERSASKLTDDHITMLKEAMVRESSEKQTTFAESLGYESSEAFFKASPDDIRARYQLFLMRNGGAIGGQGNRIKIEGTTYGKKTRCIKKTNQTYRRIVMEDDKWITVVLGDRTRKVVSE